MVFVDNFRICKNTTYTFVHAKWLHLQHFKRLANAK